MHCSVMSLDISLNRPSCACRDAPQWLYNDPFPPLWDELAKPALPYTAPELVGGWGGPQVGVRQLPSSSLGPSCIEHARPHDLPSSPLQAALNAGGRVTGAADVFSLACVAYELLAQPSGLGGQQQQLLPVRSSLADYRARVMGAGGEGPLTAELAHVHAHLQSEWRG